MRIAWLGSRIETYKERGEVERLSALGRLLVRDGLLFVHGGDDGDEEILAIFETGGDFLAQVAFGDLDIVLGVTLAIHQVEETIINVDLSMPSILEDESCGGVYARVGIRYGGRWERPCCGWRGKYLPVDNDEIS